MKSFWDTLYDLCHRDCLIIAGIVFMLIVPIIVVGSAYVISQQTPPPAAPSPQSSIVPTASYTPPAQPHPTGPATRYPTGVAEPWLNNPPPAALPTAPVPAASDTVPAPAGTNTVQEPSSSSESALPQPDVSAPTRSFTEPEPSYIEAPTHKPSRSTRDQEATDYGYKMYNDFQQQVATHDAKLKADSLKPLIYQCVYCRSTVTQYNRPFSSQGGACSDSKGKVNEGGHSWIEIGR